MEVDVVTGRPETTPAPPGRVRNLLSETPFPVRAVCGLTALSPAIATMEMAVLRRYAHETWV